MHTLPDPLRRDSLAGGLLRALPCAVVLRNPSLEIEIFGGPAPAQVTAPGTRAPGRLPWRRGGLRLPARLPHAPAAPLSPGGAGQSRSEPPRGASPHPPERHRSGATGTALRVTHQNGGPGYALAMREAFPVECFHADFTHSTRFEGLHPGYGPESGR